MRQKLRKIYLDLLGSISKPSSSVHILNIHYVNELSNLEDYIIFDNLLLKLSKSYNLINFEDALIKIRNQEKVLKPELAFTIDDGFIECYNTIYPVLNKFNISAYLFTNPSVIESTKKKKKKFLKKRLLTNQDKHFMTWNHIKELKDNKQIIGNHTMNHLALNKLSYESAFQEIYSAKLFLEKKLNYDCKYFAFPYGNPKYFDENGVKAALNCHDLIFSSGQYEKYFFKSNDRILSRRHAEGNWSKNHIDYFLSKKRNY